MKKIRKAKGRSVNEWIGATPDAKPPDRVRLRILRRHDNKCFLSGILIADGQAFDLDHKVSLEDGGENRENNLVPVLRLPHEIKTAAERKRQAKADRLAKRAHGMARPSKPIPSRPFPATDKRPKIDKSELPKLPPRMLYADK